ncbi:hypothetical protein [Amycolatopsis sp. WAC 01375]|uniref:hypothetical protein n=1 Tax=Amycolatopsis sp. WAC 01375 TaxID=2203194 RepID=UPI000F796075|nr:hypothetical protein [Amycolatopsis sp. WAC 01375]
MMWWQAALWALAGGFVVEGLEFAALQRRYRKWPWQVDADAAEGAGGTAAGPLGYFVAELVRLAAGGILGAALSAQVTGPLPAVAIGAAAPVIAGHLAAYVPLPPIPSQDGQVAGAAPPPVAHDGLDHNSAAAKPTQERRHPSPDSESLPESRGMT